MLFFVSFYDLFGPVTGIKIKENQLCKHFSAKLPFKLPVDIVTRKLSTISKPYITQFYLMIIKLILLCCICVYLLLMYIA